MFVQSDLFLMVAGQKTMLNLWKSAKEGNPVKLKMLPMSGECRK